MLDLWKKRLRKHQMEQFKYLKLVFNDHFVIALIFLIGALGVGYASLVRLVAHAYWWGPIVLSLIYSLILAIGRFANLIEAADSTFLLPKEGEFFHYLLAARKYSLILPIIVIFGLNLAILPLTLVLVQGSSVWTVILMALSTLIFKDVLLWVELMNCYDGNTINTNWLLNKSFWYGLALLSFLLGFYVSPIITVVLALIGNLWLRHQVINYVISGNLRFSVVIANENARQFRILKIYNLFTDVPSLQSPAKRRKYLDPFLRLVKPNHENSFLYLFFRGFLRGTEYLGFYLRFVIIGTIILFFIHQIWVGTVLYLLFLYLSGFQLLPFYSQYDGIVFTKLYPVTSKAKLHSFQQLLVGLMSVQWLIMSMPLIINFYQNPLVWVCIAVGLLFVLAFVYGYSKTRIKKV
ncbi:ABC transporter permease [Agrilactobacillus fermenti]|uniref:ABC transporter permease n=1 Tax=Agrilactobacillus fermenti TaxID=2586909 RepID=UPI0022A9E2A7|nr:ABC transporter permease [Agrilactobacillus fermenti]MCD2256648.1 ABC transporter permease [Agrilactobacillus fermenti]